MIMKKNFIYLAMTLLVGLFSSCSQEETVDASASQSKLFSITAELPTEYRANTRAIPAVDNHYLRCILEITDMEGNRVHREEKLGTDANTDGKLSFSFAIEAAGTYDYRMWADFIDANGQGKDPVTGRYTDKFFHTEDLTKITVIDPAALYNTDACDAFSGHGSFEKGQATIENPLSVTLIRPFAKLIVSDKSKENFDKCTTVSVSQEIPAGFDVSTGTVSSKMVTATLPASKPLGTGIQTGETHDLELFSCYIFADNDALGEIAMTFVTTDGGREIAIPANVPVKKNTRTLLRGYLVAESQNNGQIDTDFDEWNPDLDGGDVEPSVPTVNPEVGFFFYNDGTYSKELDTKTDTRTCIGVIFDLAEGDDVTNYPSLGFERINGWVIALDDAGVKKAWASSALGDGEVLEGVTLLASIPAAVNELAGYNNTKAISAQTGDRSFPSQKACIDWSPAVEGTSGWYMPSIGQLARLFSTYESINEKLTAAGGQPISENVYLSSTLYNGATVNPLGITFKKDDSNYGVNRAQKITSGYNSRAILTF